VLDVLRVDASDEVNIDAAMPFLREAEAAYNFITKRDVTEMRNIAHPADIARFSFDGLLILQSKPVGPVVVAEKVIAKQKANFIKDSYFEIAVQEYLSNHAETEFPRTLLDFMTNGRDKINNETCELLEPYLRYDAEPAKNWSPWPFKVLDGELAAKSCRLGGAVCKFVCAMVQYHIAANMPKPKPKEEAKKHEARPFWHPEVVREMLERGEFRDPNEVVERLPVPHHEQDTMLVLGDQSASFEEEIACIRDHRWFFTGAVEFARQGRGLCSLIRCLLDLQENVQLDEEGVTLDAKLVRACKTFVHGQTVARRGGEMYHVLSHYISNAPIFDQWQKYLADMLSNESITQDSNLVVAYLDQVWGRFMRLRDALETVFGVLDGSYAWELRFPTVRELVNQHMRRRCFSSQSMLRLEVFAGVQVRSDESVRQIRSTFDL
jgi:hypothetical protein